jgi:hypothetical protein
MIDRQKKQALEAARRKNARENLKKYSTGKNKGVAKGTINDAKELIKSATPWGFLSLLFQANIISDWMYGLALMAALFKDLLDFVEVVGFLYVIVIISTFLVSIFIGFMMLLGSFYNFSEGSKRIDNTQRKIIRSWLVLMGGTTAEMLFGVNILPIETLTVLILYGFVLSARKQAREQERKEQEIAQTREVYA